MNKLIIIAVLILSLYRFSVAQMENDVEIEKLCATKDQCSSCLEAHSQCTWCIDSNVMLSSRCSTKSHQLINNCNAEKIIQNRAETKILENIEVRDYQEELDGSNARVIQLQPQNIQMNLFKSSSQTFKLTYRPAANYPLNLYVLMDLSWSMRDDRETFLKLGEELTKTLGSLTENYRLGFGSFADKPTMPMSSPNTKSNPCISQGNGAICEPTYGFRHHLAMSKDVQEFVRQVNNSQVTANLDNLEGGFDALMQVIVCVDEIGWTPGARKVVLLVSDGFIHFAGDGKLAGATIINDKKCHLNDAGEYTGSLIYDYPSLEQIYRELTRRKVNVIFAVTEEVAPIYRQIVNLMKEISGVEILASNSSNILQLIEQGHQTLINKVQFESIGVPSEISIKYETTCGGLYGNLEETNYCDNIQEGKQFDFYVTLTMNDYPLDGIYKHKIRVEASGLSEFVEIDVDMQEPCPCTEEVTSPAQSSSLCNNHGIFQCGMCSCDKGWMGTNCICDVQGDYTNRGLDDDCRPKLSSNREICSGRGECDCGQCLCAEGYTGKYCECPECNQCDPEREICVCGKCVCAYGWYGGECNCRNEACIAPNDKSICSNRGQCNCNQCKCEKPYFGKFCETNSRGTSMLCDYFESCANCLISRRLKSSTPECNDNMETICSSNDNKSFIFEFVDTTLDDDNTCIIRVVDKNGDKIDHVYVYNIDSSGISYLKIFMQVNEPYNFATLSLITLGITLFVGLTTLVALKIITDIKNRREMEKFQEESEIAVKNAQHRNPLYKNPLLKYSIPHLFEETF